MDAQLTHKEVVVLTQFPQELITEVLMWLPVKSLLHFRCLSKSFCAIIDSQYFVNSHMRRSANEWSHLKLIFIKRNKISTNYNLAKLDVSDFDIRQPYGIDVYGYCNGIFLLLANKSMPVLWNPSAHQYRILPSLADDLDDLIVHHILIRMGLGYESSQDEYKVVVLEPFAVELHPIRVEYRVWILGLKSNSWRRVCTYYPARASAFIFSYFGYFADGDLHWLCSNLSEHQDIVAFDLAKETFSVLTQHSYYPVNKMLICLNVLDGCLCIGFCTSVIKDEALLYVRKKEGEKFMLRLLYSVARDQLPPFLELHNFNGVGVLGYTNEGDKIILDLGLKYMISYDLKEKSFQPTEITRPNNELFYGTRSLVESLVSVSVGDP